MSYLLYLMFRCDRRCDGCDGKFGNFVGTKHTHDEHMVQSFQKKTHGTSTNSSLTVQICTRPGAWAGRRLHGVGRRQRCGAICDGAVREPIRAGTPPVLGVHGTIGRLHRQTCRSVSWIPSPQVIHFWAPRVLSIISSSVMRFFLLNSASTSESRRTNKAGWWGQRTPPRSWSIWGFVSSHLTRPSGRLWIASGTKGSSSLQTCLVVCFFRKKSAVR